MGHGLQLKFPNVKYRDFVTHTVFTQSPFPVSPKSTSPPPSTVTAGKEPIAFKEAMIDEGWCKAMQEEIRALEDNGIWVMEDLPQNKKGLGHRWVYKIKYKSDGSIERLKARLVIFGNHQVEGIDYVETFSPIAKMVTVRAFLAVASSKN
ncbi:uncharacterized protein LOC110698154 [Chenopodium quinoa]|uniref:uncharacterized protein LOC110698154 n=1 Tax=Chenopodium quinoa TaxID=63459 RepID=UPI000B782B06|nr:uncharacterized protein LOC110698154 [Chenopodium quinoa]